MYEKYITSPVPWIKEIPSHWALIRGKNLYKKMQRPVRKEDGVVTCFRDGTVTLRKNRRTTGFTESLQEIGYQGIKKGDLVIHVMDAFAGSIGVSDSDGKGTPVYNVCQAIGDSNNFYFALLLREMARTGYIQSLYRGIRERSSDFRFEVFASQFYPVPPRDEQEQIVRFLDWKVSAINRLINLRRKEITALENLKRSIIYHAVTHGIKPNVPMKDSGVQWIGKIPEHWEIIKLKAVSSMRAGNNLTATQINPNEGGYQVYGGNGQRGFYDDYNIDGEFLLIGRQGALCGNVHKVKGKIWATDHAVITRLMQEMNIDYGYYLLLAMNLNQYSSDTAAQPGLSVNVIKNLYTVLPPIKEQIDISSSLVDKCSQLNKTMDYTMQAISVLQELKARLISDVVTGKIDVRGVEVPEFAPVEEEAGEEETVLAEEEANEQA